MSGSIGSAFLLAACAPPGRASALSLASSTFATSAPRRSSCDEALRLAASARRRTRWSAARSASCISRMRRLGVLLRRARRASASAVRAAPTASGRPRASCAPRPACGGSAQTSSGVVKWSRRSPGMWLRPHQVPGLQLLAGPSRRWSATRRAPRRCRRRSAAAAATYSSGIDLPDRAVDAPAAAHLAEMQHEGLDERRQVHARQLFLKLQKFKSRQPARRTPTTGTAAPVPDQPARRRRRQAARPSSPRPSSAAEAGSGTTKAAEPLNRLAKASGPEP